MAALDMKPDGAAGAAALTLRCDVTGEADVDSAMAEVAARLGPVDVLVNNAGITGSQAAARCHETPVEEWDRVQAVNVRGPFLCSRAVLPSMIARGPGTSSRSRPSPGWSPSPAGARTPRPRARR